MLLLTTRQQDFLLLPAPQPRHRHHHRHKHYPYPTFWAKIALPNGGNANYQLSKDIQLALRQYIKAHPKDWFMILLGVLINIPIAPYDPQGHTVITAGKVKKVWMSKRHTSNPAAITRSQFVKPSYSRLGFRKTQQALTYLRHNYGPTSEQQIKYAIQYFYPFWRWPHHDS